MLNLFKLFNKTKQFFIMLQIKKDSCICFNKRIGAFFLFYHLFFTSLFCKRLFLLCGNHCTCKINIFSVFLTLGNNIYKKQVINSVLLYILILCKISLVYFYNKAKHIKAYCSIKKDQV